MACNCMRQVITASSVAVTATTTTVTLPATFIPVAGNIYDISLAAAIPDGTAGTVINITNGTISGPLLNRLGNNVRMRSLSPQMILRVMYLGDPDHYNLISIRARCV